MSAPSPLVLEPTRPADSTLLLVHGLGTSGPTYVPMGRRLQLGVRAPLRVVLPTAPQRPVSLTGQSTTAWFDLRHPDFQRQEDEEGVTLATDHLTGLVEEQLAVGIAAERIIVAGFSQGGALALRVGTSLPHRLAGIAVLSGWLALADRTRSAHSPETDRVPVFLGHGVDDEVSPRGWADEAVQWLEGRGHPVTRHDYPIGHAINLDEINDLTAWADGLL